MVDEQSLAALTAPVATFEEHRAMVEPFLLTLQTTERALLGGAMLTWLCLRRRLRKDRAWVIRVQLRSNDPHGPDVVTVVVATKSDVAPAVARLEAEIRAGTLVTSSDGSFPT